MPNASLTRVASLTPWLSSSIPKHRPPHVSCAIKACPSPPPPHHLSALPCPVLQAGTSPSAADMNDTAYLAQYTSQLTVFPSIT